MPYVDEDGVVHEDENGRPDNRTPLQIAQSELAAFKFRLIETVTGDLRLGKAPCTEAIVVFTGFLQIDKHTLKPTTVYASATKLMARGRMKSKTTARLARQLLEKFGYLVRTGSSTKDGCVKYRVENPHYERVQASVRESEEYWTSIEANRRKEERRKKRFDVGTNIDPTETGRGDSNCPDVGTNIDPNYHRGNLGGIGSEDEAQPIKVSTAPPDIPFPVPASETEARLLILSLLDGRRPSPAQLWFLQTKLMAGELTMKHIDDLEDAA